MANETDQIADLDLAVFEQVDMRVGTVLEAKIFQKARKPAYQLRIDFGPIGIKQSSAQITDRYSPEGLIGKQLIAVVNFPPKQIANFWSECLVLGTTDASGKVTLMQPERKVANGSRIH